jgi:hypothetical protein
MTTDNIDEYNLVGQKYLFPDGNGIKVVQIKMRDDGIGVTPYVTFLTFSGKGIPRKEVVTLTHFIGSFGHLFGIKDPPTQPYR